MYYNSLDYGNVPCSFSENLLSKINQKCYVLMFPFKIIGAKMIVQEYFV